MKHFSKESTQLVEENWPDDYDFVIRTAGGGRKKTKAHLGKVWWPNEKPKLNMGLTPIKCNIDSKVVFERMRTLEPDEVMYFSLHPFMSVKDIVRWYCLKYHKEKYKL